jgi:hypothetical protein
MSKYPISRRALLGGIGVAGVLATSGMPGVSLAGENQKVVGFVDPSLSQKDLKAAHAALASMTLQTLEPELVSQWRRELRERIAKGHKAVAMVRWDKAFVLQGLAREEGFAVREQRLSRAMFRVDIG